MNDVILWMLSITSFLVVYWVILGQWKYNKMMRNPSNVKAILFDLDGVLVDSIDAWIKNFNDTRKHFNLKPISKKEFLDKLWGKSIEYDQKHYFKKQSIKELEAFFLKNLHNFQKETKLFPEVRETLEILKKEKYKLAVVTNTTHKGAVSILKHHKILEYFDEVIGGDEVENGKPEPDLLLQACKQLRIRPHNALMVGDTKSDKEASHHADTTFVGFNTKGQYSITNFKDLLLLLS